MAADLKLYARLLAHNQRRAVLYATHQRVAIREDALMLSFLAMAGEGDTMHIVSIGRAGQEPVVKCVPDPRVRTLQHRLYRWLAGELERYFLWCLEHETYPQVWVASPVARHHLGHIADAIRYRRDEPRVQLLSDMLSYLVERAEVAGQQSLMVASQVLAEHFATPQAPSDDEHLGALLCWIEPPPIIPIDFAIAQVERTPAGVKTPADFDRQVLIPLVMGFNEARRSRQQQRAGDAARHIRTALEPMVARVHALTQEAIQVLQRRDLPVLPDLEAMEELEAREFAFFMRGIQADEPFRPGSSDSVSQAIYKLTKREGAQANLEASLIIAGGVEKAQAILSGRVLVGEVTGAQKVRVGGRNRLQFELRSQQRVLSMRPGDELARLDDSRFAVRILSMRSLKEGGTSMTCQILKGQRTFGLPAHGAQLELFASHGSWGAMGWQLAQIKKRLAHSHWLHHRDTVPSPAPVQPQPTNLLELVESLS